MNMEQFTKTGKYHQCRGEVCQDHTLCKVSGRYIFAAAADGATSCEYGKEGAEAACLAAESFFDMEGEAVFRYSDEKLSYLLVEHIMYFLEGMYSADEADIQSYASTVIAAFINRFTGQSVLVNLGDGAVLSSEKNRVRTVLAPRKFFGQPSLTTHNKAYKYVQVKKEYLDTDCFYILCTDGFLDAVSETDNALEMIKLRDFSKLNNMLSSFDEPDDIGYVTAVRE